MLYFLKAWDLRISNMMFPCIKCKIHKYGNTKCLKDPWYICEKHGIQGYQIWQFCVSNVKYTNAQIPNTQIQSAKGSSGCHFFIWKCMLGSSINSRISILYLKGGIWVGLLQPSFWTLSWVQRMEGSILPSWLHPTHARWPTSMCKVAVKICNCMCVLNKVW